MSNVQEENCSAKAKKKRKKRPFSCLSCFCFTGSAVSDPDAPAPPAAGGSKSKSSTWFSWSRFPSRTKRTTALPATVENPTAAHAQEEEEKKPRAAPAAKTNARTQVKKPPQESNSISDSNLPTISLRYNACHEPATLVVKSDRIRVGATIDQPKASKHVGRPPGSADSDSSTITPMFGLWVMVTTLAIMVLAGRVAATFWFCSSLYLLRHRRRHRPTALNVNSWEPKDLDVDSDEHKKRVVLQGLLERNGKRPSLAGFGGVRQVYRGIKSSGSTT